MVTLSHKEVINLLAESSGYFKYQCEDILHFLAVVIAQQVKDGNSLKIKGLGIFEPKKQRIVKNYSPYIKKYLNVLSKKNCKFKADLLFLNKLNDKTV